MYGKEVANSLFLVLVLYSMYILPSAVYSMYIYFVYVLVPNSIALSLIDHIWENVHSSKNLIFWIQVINLHIL